MIIDEEACPAIYPALTAGGIATEIGKYFGTKENWRAVDHGAGPVGEYHDVQIVLEYHGPTLFEVASSYDLSGDDKPGVGSWESWPTVMIRGCDSWFYEFEPVLMRCGSDLLNCYRITGVAKPSTSIINW